MKQYFLVIVFSLISFAMVAQSDDDKKKDGGKKEDQEEKKWTNDLFFGGSLWAQFGAVTQVEVAPVAGYYISSRIHAGIGARYIYYKTNSLNIYGSTAEIPNYSSHIFGGSVFTRYVIIEDLNELLPIQLHGRFISHFEYEALNIPTNMDDTEERSGGRFWSNNYLIGGGLQQKIGEKAYINLLLLFNLNQKRYTPYENPILRIGINF